ncbi:MAG: hypothetical protein OXC93_16540, partial [Rhodospirillaceae bacterium]|nr:hypothetical protein [Rhodospirillaceae bacterium]
EAGGWEGPFGVEGEGRPVAVRVHPAAGQSAPDVTMPTAGQGLQAEPGEFPGQGATRRLSLPDAQGRGRDQSLIHENMMISRTYDSDTYVPGTGHCDVAQSRVLPLRRRLGEKLSEADRRQINALPAMIHHGVSSGMRC